MATNRRDVLKTSMDPLPNTNDPLRDLFEACKVGDIARVRKLITPTTVNARDTAGRKSTPLHFAAGKSAFLLVNILQLFNYICGAQLKFFCFCTIQHFHKYV